MRWETVWRDAMYELAHCGGAACLVWDLAAGGSLVLLGLWLAFEIWHRPEAEFVQAGLRERFPMPRLAESTRQGLAELASAAHRDLERAERAEREAAQSAEQAIERVARLEERTGRAEAELDVALASMPAVEKRMRDLERKAASAQEAVAKAARELADSPSAVNALRAGEVEMAGEEAVKEAALAAEEREWAGERLARAEAEVARLKQALIDARAAVQTANREAREAHKTVAMARTVSGVVEKAIRKGRFGYGLAEGDGSRAEGTPVETKAKSTAARAAAKLLGRDLGNLS